MPVAFWLNKLKTQEFNLYDDDLSIQISNYWELIEGFDFFKLRLKIYISEIFWFKIKQAEKLKIP